MKETTKLVLVGIAGYLVGFYEMKYKAQKALLEILIEQGKKAQ